MKFLLLVLNMIMCLSSCSAQQKLTNKDHNPCEGMSKMETMECKLQIIDSLNSDISDLIDVLSDKFKKESKFLSVQKEWQLYSDSHCESYLDVLGGSNQTQIILYDCKIEMLKTRITSLEMFEEIN